jgi:hypothetical protein
MLAPVTQAEWVVFSAFREAFRGQVESWNRDFAAELALLQRRAAERDTPSYPLETPVVYNAALDEVRAEDAVRLIIVGDNPGKDEQRAQNRRYLVGQAGKLGDGFFRARPELGIDFRSDAIILNKTPVHSAKTAHLRALVRSGSPVVRRLVQESQRFMAEQTARLHHALCGSGCMLWLVGYAELKPRGIFSEYRDALLRAYECGASPAWSRVLVFQHFSQNRFSVDLKGSCGGTVPTDGTLAQRLFELGTRHKTEIFEHGVH